MAWIIYISDNWNIVFLTFQYGDICCTANLTIWLDMEFDYG